jgi:hypothetical protein
MTDPVLHLHEAVRAALLTQAAYGKTPYPDSPPGTQFTMIDGMELHPPVDVQCLIVREPAAIWFAFRGTDDARKFLSDADIRFHDIGEGLKVHAGAWRLLDAIWPMLVHYVLLYDALPVFTTGHSLGGMLARLFTLRLARERNINVEKSWTFGEGRTLNRAAAAFYNRLDIPTWRIVHASDVVPRVPWRLGLFRHVGRFCYIAPNGDIEFDQPWWYRAVPDFFHFLHDLTRRKNALIGDHGIAEYLQEVTTARIQMEE